MRTEQTVHFHPRPETFKANAREALADKPLRKSLRTAMDMLMTKRKIVLSDEQELQMLRTLCEHIRQRSLSKLPDLLEQLESNLTRLGVKVHWAETPDEACRIIHGIIMHHQGKLMVKGKSMVSEEIELNHYLADRGIKAVESDLGEYIVQMAGEKPTHIVMPAIHKTKEQVSELFHNNIGTPLTDDVDQLTGFARQALRDVYRTADVGLSGVNFAVAETGTLCLVENEGNGRLSTTVPPVHIAITGIEKVVAKLSDIPPLYSLLPRSAIGHHLFQHDYRPAPFRRAGRPTGNAPRVAGQRPQPGLRRRTNAPHPAMHPLRRVHEPLPRVYPHRRRGLRHHLSRPDWRNPVAAPARPGAHPRPAHRLHHVRRVRGSLPRKNPDYRTNAAPARRSPARARRSRALSD